MDNTAQMEHSGADHHHNPNLAHHFHDMEQQHESIKLGVWLFLVTEVLLFGGLFCFYAIYRAWHPEMFIEVNQLLNVKLGALNTLVLIFSSVTVALSIRSIQMDNKKHAVMFLGITIVCAAMFLVVKYFEYSHKIHEGLLPGKYFVNPEINAVNPHIFFSIYFGMTGLHALHILGGMTFLTWVMYRTHIGTYSSSYYTPVEMGGLYWHLVDLIWIYLFPLLYLIG